MSRPVFSFRPNLKNPEHEKAWQLLMEIPTGAEEPVSGGCDPGTRREGNFKKTHSGGCWEELNVAMWNGCQHRKGRNSRSDAGFFISDGAGVKEVRPMDKENMALLDLLGFCIPLTWIL